ncbi:MAG: PAS domain S-box protein [Candidatus Abyssobacteria bacterium SURF_17]|uniref:PAS domain S-box protein n=1 Tax=Candidatus Abyssobacteria bacterium SURF_17 TaxID=2093361 RepID=A0A419EPP4_9BACT|nr:MAG: PAS domain S-box protein [Candidatus Abyssubacteria bacterium SURF_17]
MTSWNKNGAMEGRDIILDSVADGVFTVDEQWHITSFNRAAEEITGISREEAIGNRCCDVFKASICETDCSLKRTLETGRPIVNKAVYIIDADGERVPISISTAILRDALGRAIGGVETFRDLSIVEDLRKELTRKYTFGDIISKNHEMQKLFDILPEVAESDSTVLFEGESGTGKELFARAIHNLSSRRKRPMVVVNCGALPDTLLESELFGYKAGAFTDAKKDKPGRFTLARGGTIFLDEIGDVSAALQVRLLRVLQERTYEPLGATEPVQADVRVVAATNKDLGELVAKGVFRQDLYYRINVVKLTLPPLRERMEDVPLLVDHLVARFNRLRGKDIVGVSPEVLAIFMSHDFPGNVRELENIIEHAFVLCRNSVILPEHLPHYLRPLAEAAAASSGVASMQELEARFIRDTLRRHNGNRSATAKALGMHKTTLWRKMKRLGIEIPEKSRRRQSD